MDKMHPRAVDLSHELAEPVELALPSTPVKPVPPVAGETAHVGKARTGGPRLPGRLVRPARAPEAVLEIGNGRVLNVESEGLRGCRDHGPLSSSRVRQDIGP